MVVQINKILNNGRALYLAYDQGMEHGPIEFNLKNCDPNYILDIALEGHYNGIIMQGGLAEKYYHDFYKDTPLIAKLNAHTSIVKKEPVSRQVCSVERAMKMGASAVGYTIFIGSEHQDEMMVEFGKIVDRAHNYGLPAIAWMYPRGKFAPEPTSTETLAYAARIGAELGADLLKMYYNNDVEGFKWVVRNAGRTKILASGGEKMNNTEEFLKKTHDIMQTGAIGMAIGRNIWQHERPFSLTKALQSIIFHNKSVEEAKKFL